MFSCEPENDGPVRGVFWVIDDIFLAVPFREGAYSEGVAKSCNTYNHERLWAALRISDKPFDYYPRGRVHVSAHGRVDRRALKTQATGNVNVRTPFKKGDIVTLDCRPFAPLAHGLIRSS